MRLCFNTANRSPHFVPDANLEAQAIAAARAGFRLLGPDLENVRAFLASGRTLDDLASLLAELELGCLELASLHMPADETAAGREIDFVTEVARALRPEAVVGIVHGPPARAPELLRRAAGQLAQAGSVLAIEFMPLSPVRTLDDALALLAATGNDRIRIVVDTWHLHNTEGSWAALEQLNPRLLGYIQINDGQPFESNDVTHETLNRRVMPGEGIFDLDRFRAVLAKLGFDGGVSVEVLNAIWRPAGRLDEFARRAYAAGAAFIGAVPD